MVGIQTLVSHYKYPRHHRVSAGMENREMFFLCSSKFKGKMSAVWTVGCNCLHVSIVLHAGKEVVI